MKSRKGRSGMENGGRESNERIKEREFYFHTGI